MLTRLIFMLLGATLFQAQLTFTAVEANLRFQYPAGWRVTVEENSTIRVVNFESSITIYPPGSLAADQVDSLTAVTSLAVDAAVGTTFKIANGTTSEVAVGDHSVSRYDFLDNDGGKVPLFILVRHLDDPLVLLTIAPASEFESAERVALEIARTIHRPTSMPDMLTNYDADWSLAIAELEQHGLIEPGGELVFEESRIFFDGEGDWVTILSARSIHSNVVMAGTLRFRPGNISEDETCGLLTRIVTDSDGKASAWLNVGIDNDHEVYYQDRLNTVQQVGGVTMPGFDLEALHHYLVIAHDDTVTVYVDGQLIIQQATITTHTGSYGIALQGRGPNALCEGLNIWAYGLPSEAPPACIISASRFANKRSGPATHFAQTGRLERGTIQNATGKTRGSDGFTWWQLDDSSWVRSDVVNNQGSCDTLSDTSG